MSPGLWYWSCCCGGDSDGIIGIIGKRRNSSNVYVPALLLIYYTSYMDATLDFVCAGDLYYDYMPAKLSFDFFDSDGLIVSSIPNLMVLGALPTDSTFPPAANWLLIANNLLDSNNYPDVVAGVNVQENGDEWENYDLFVTYVNKLNRYYYGSVGTDKEIISASNAIDTAWNGGAGMFAARGPSGECGVIFAGRDTHYLMRADRPNGYGFGDGDWTVSTVPDSLYPKYSSVCFGKTRMEIAYYSQNDFTFKTTLPNPSFAAYPDFPIGGVALGSLDMTRFSASIAYTPVTNEYSLTFAIQSASGVTPAYTYILHYTHVDGAWSANPEIVYYVASRGTYFQGVKCLYETAGNPWIIATTSDHTLYIFHKNSNGAWGRAFADQSFGLWDTHTVRVKKIVPTS